MLLDNPGAELRWKRIVADSGACVLLYAVVRL